MSSYLRWISKSSKYLAKMDGYYSCVFLTTCLGAQRLQTLFTLLLSCSYIPCLSIWPPREFVRNSHSSLPLQIFPKIQNHWMGAHWATTQRNTQPNTFGFLANRCPSHPSSVSVLSPSLGHCFMSRGQLVTIKWIISLPCTPCMANGEKFDSIHSMTASLPSWNSVHFNAAILTSFYFISFICRSPLALRCWWEF